MKYEVGQKVEILNAVYKGRVFEVEHIDTTKGESGAYQVNGQWWTDGSLKPVESKPKHTPEQQEYLDKCAIAAMQGMASNSELTDYFSGNIVTPVPSLIATTAYDVAYAMLAERERRAKQ